MRDRVVAVDWSARARPARGRDSIWLAVDDGAGASTENPPTRSAAEARLWALLDEAAGRGWSTLVAIDASLGYPSGTAAAVGAVAGGGGGNGDRDRDCRTWVAMWEMLDALIEDAPDNRNNRFEVAAELNARIATSTGQPGPFWGCPATARHATLTSTKPPIVGLPEWRTVEAALRATGRRPSSSWQLLGAGAVGSQSLLAIPVMQRLRCARAGVGVWPFEPTDDGPGTTTIVEMWPSLLTPSPAAVRDEGQVIAAASFLRSAPDVGLWSDVPAAAVDEEGWIVGVPRGASCHGEVAARLIESSGG
ncbi:MAG: hypothetical protein AAGA42_02245 [Actinomycetota bacterium]